MRNVFLLYMPPGNPVAMVHYEDTIKRRVSLDRLVEHISHELYAKLRVIFGTVPIAIWGSQAGPKNRSNFERMSEGDDIIIVEGNIVRLIGKIAAKTQSTALSHELWKPIRRGDETVWELIYFVANPRELELPFAKFCRLFGYQSNFQLRGFTTVSPERLQTFYSKYDDLYSILVRLQDGQPVKEKQGQIQTIELPSDSATAPGAVPPDQEVSDHVRMQWKLARLGLKAGERVWVPVADQARLKRDFRFESFDSEFSAGVDLPHSYVENIDVVWKQEFRIGAAYEIENSTAIYSGLLRFADLNILAPNTLYPMFVVAPQSRKNRVREQLRRPTFKQLDLDRRVRFLSYETVDEIDSFFLGSDSGLNVNLILGRSEAVV